MNQAPPVEYIELDGESYSEYELDESFTPPEYKPLEMYLAEIVHELRTIRYQVDSVLEQIRNQ